MTSPDLTQVNVEKLLELFPSVATETIREDGTVAMSIDFDLLRQELSDVVVDGPEERYQLDWPGKRAAAFAANTPIAKTLRPEADESVDFDSTRNLFIEGDNLDALKLLQESYLGKVKLIYIDPPYNTGNDFVYRDDFAQSTAEYLAGSGQIDEEGNRFRANLETNGRFHSDWLSMMYPRLKLARNLLTQDGAIFMSIDDAELDNLLRIGKEIFGEANFIGTMVWAAGRKNDSKFISASHEYIVCFARNKAALKEAGVTWKVKKKGLAEIYAEAARIRKTSRDDFAAASKALKAWFSSLPDSAEAKRHKHYSNIDARGVYFADNISWPGGGGPRYDVLHPVTRKPVKVPSRGWLFQSAAMERHVADDRVGFGADELSVPTFKRYLHDTESEVSYSVFYQDGRAASKRLRTLMNGQVFDFPKDETVLQTLIAMTTDGDDIVLDLFAGSGSTAHAVLAQNAQDGHARRFIMVQLDETPAPDSEASKQGYSTIAAVARERIKRAANVIATSTAKAASLDAGYRALRVDTTNMRDVLRDAASLEQLDLGALEENVKDDRSGHDLLFQVLLDWGLDLSLGVEELNIEGRIAYSVDDGALIACFERNVDVATARAIARQEPLRAVFLDSAFSTDSPRINVGQIFAELSPSTDLRVL
ncbi:site-specific DNA-methyltransferase [Agrococcus sediminis]|nr:site-specific DNA-methyltransferase [Agrococcus sediminis]